MKKGVLILLIFMFFSTACFADVVIPPPPTPFGTLPSSTANVPAPPTPFEQQQVQNQTTNETLPPSPSAPSTEPVVQPATEQPVTTAETFVTQPRTRHALAPPNPQKIISVEVPQEQTSVIEPPATPSLTPTSLAETQKPVITPSQPSMQEAKEVEIIVAPKKTSWLFVIGMIGLFAFLSGGAYAVMRYFEEQKKQSSELDKYIDTAQKQGFKLPVIKQALLQAGWSDKTIDEKLSGVKK